MATTDTRRLRVRAGRAEYDVLVGNGLLARMPALLAERGLPAARAVVVSNTTVGPLYGAALAEALGAPLLTIPDGEQHKTLATLGALCQGMLDAGMDRDSLVIAVGGGVVGDVAGFAAASYMRGVRVVQVPTSLLAMVDASVGGKTGVDLPGGKNMVGAFWQPALVVVDVAVLGTLPPVEVRCGLAEALKHGLIDDPALFARLETGQTAIDAALLEQAIAVKARVVEADALEHGVRAHLNLGHTFAHAIETVSGYQWKHGEAVAVGLAGAARLSAALGLFAQALPARIEAALTRLGLRCAMPASTRRRSGKRWPPTRSGARAGHASC
ncbi:MAG: 3-dehydroquinate synthase [Anaerolineae bacterium]|nr:3-dehydroquinate synthase [Anaerolineae bacterium]